MKLKATFKGIEHTPSLDEKIHQKSQKLKKYFEGNLDVQWVCSVGEDGRHVADIKLLGPNFNYHATGAADSLYKAFDVVIGKIERQVVKKKSKWKNQIHGGKHQQTSIRKDLMEDVIKDEEFWQEKDDSIAS